MLRMLARPRARAQRNADGAGRHDEWREHLDPVEAPRARYAPATVLIARVAEWQTQGTQNPSQATACGFDSRPGHNSHGLKPNAGSARSRQRFRFQLHPPGQYPTALTRVRGLSWMKTHARNSGW